MKLSKFNIDKLVKNFDKVKNELPIILGNQAQNHFVEGFRKGGGQTDAGRWRERKRNRKKNQGRAILVKSSTLMRDIIRRKASFGRTVVSTINTPYAAIHNEGLQGKAFGKYPFKMPKREFIGISRSLDDKQIRVVNNYLQKL